MQSFVPPLPDYPERTLVVVNQTVTLPPYAGVVIPADRGYPLINEEELTWATQKSPRKECLVLGWLGEPPSNIFPAFASFRWDECLEIPASAHSCDQIREELFTLSTFMRHNWTPYLNPGPNWSDVILRIALTRLFFSMESLHTGCHQGLDTMDL